MPVLRFAGSKLINSGKSAYVRHEVKEKIEGRMISTFADLVHVIESAARGKNYLGNLHAARRNSFNEELRIDLIKSQARRTTCCFDGRL